jgi:hypothetical protein
MGYALAGALGFDHNSLEQVNWADWGNSFVEVPAVNVKVDNNNDISKNNATIGVGARQKYKIDSSFKGTQVASFVLLLLTKP